jgi:mRNA-degrading endonuclease toxin of MazEF toxin-antitoxin module
MGRRQTSRAGTGGPGLKTQFAVWRYNFLKKGEHPCILISHPDISARATLVNILFCTSQRQSRSPKLDEVLLDESDGFDWETFVVCSQMWLVESSSLHGYSGMVSTARRNAIRDKLRDFFRLAARD